MNWFTGCLFVLIFHENYFHPTASHGIIFINFYYILLLFSHIFLNKNSKYFSLPLYWRCSNIGLLWIPFSFSVPFPAVWYAFWNEVAWMEYSISNVAAWLIDWLTDIKALGCCQSILQQSLVWNLPLLFLSALTYIHHFCLCMNPLPAHHDPCHLLATYPPFLQKHWVVHVARSLLL